MADRKMTEEIKQAGQGDAENGDLVQLGCEMYRAGKEQRRLELKINSPVSPYEELTDDEVLELYEDYFMGDHYARSKNLDKKKSRPMANRCLDIVLGNTTNQTDAAPRYIATPVEWTDDELAEKVNAAFNYWRKKRGAYFAEIMAVMMSSMHSVGFLRQFHDPFLPGDCKIGVESVHPKQVIPDPDCTVEQFQLYGPTYIIHMQDVGVGELKKKFPNAEWDKFDPNFDIGTFGLETRTKVNESRLADKGPVKVTPLYNIWLKDPAVIEWEERFADMAVSLAEAAPESGRLVRMAGGIILSKDKNPYAHGQCDLTPVWATPITGQFWGLGDLRNVVTPMAIRNVLDQAYIDQTLRSGGAVILYNAKFLMQKITNAVVQMVRTKDVNHALKMERFPQPSRHLPEASKSQDDAMDLAAGRHNISRGVQREGNATALEVATAKETDKTRLRMRARLFQWSLERQGYQLVENLAQFQSQTWWLEVTGKGPTPGFEDKPAVRRVEFNRDTLFRDVMDQAVDPATGMQLVDQETGMPVMEPVIDLTTGKPKRERIKFDILVEDTSTLPDQHQERRAIAQMLKEWGAPLDWVLEYMQLPGTEALVKRLKEQQAAPQASGAVPPDARVAEGAPSEGGAAIPAGLEAMMAQELANQAPAPEVDPAVLDLAMRLSEIADKEGLDLDALTEMLASLVPNGAESLVGSSVGQGPVGPLS